MYLSHLIEVKYLFHYIQKITFFTTYRTKMASTQNINSQYPRPNNIIRNWIQGL